MALQINKSSGLMKSAQSIGIDLVKLIQAPCDIHILTADQAWENYCNALQLLFSREPKDWPRYRLIARQSLDQHFAEVERRMMRANERGRV